MAINAYYGDEIEKIIDEQIDKPYQARKARRKKRDWFSASNAGYCKRAAVLNRLNAKEDEHTSKQKRVFWIGDLIHQGIIDLIKKSGKLLAAEQFVGSYKTNDDVIGAFDLIMQQDGDKTCLYDLKSKSTGGFWTYVVRAGKPAKHNVYQLITYYMLNQKHKHYKVDKIALCYFSKEDAAMKTYEVEITPELIAEVKAWWDDCRGYVIRKELPPVFPEGAPERRQFCKSCTFAPHFCFGEQTTMEQNIVELKW